MERHLQPEHSKGVSPEDKQPDIYENRFNTIVNSGFVALGIALGHKVGLFKALCEQNAPETSQGIANCAGLQERYVREWLFSMVAAKVVFVTDDNKYYIPEECKAKTRLSLFATLLPGLAPLTDDVEKCFRSNDISSAGYDFSKLADVFKFIDEDRKTCDEKWLDTNLIPFKHKSKDQIKQILDIGCGTGRITVNIAKHFPNAHVTGIDIDQLGIDTANKNKSQENLKNVDFYVLDAGEMKKEWIGVFDWVTMLTVLHDLPNPDHCIKGVLSVLKENGVFTALDPVAHSEPQLNIGNIVAAATLTNSCYVCLPCSLSAPPAVGNGIGWGLENRVKYLSDNGFIVHGDELVSVVHCTKR